MGLVFLGIGSEGNIQQRVQGVAGSMFFVIALTAFTGAGNIVQVRKCSKQQLAVCSVWSVCSMWHGTLVHRIAMLVSGWLGGWMVGWVEKISTGTKCVCVRSRLCLCVSVYVCLHLCVCASVYSYRIVCLCVCVFVCVCLIVYVPYFQEYTVLTRLVALGHYFFNVHHRWSTINPLRAGPFYSSKLQFQHTDSPRVVFAHRSERIFLSIQFTLMDFGHPGLFGKNRTKRIHPGSSNLNTHGGATSTSSRKYLTMPRKSTGTRSHILFRFLVPVQPIFTIQTALQS